MYIRIVNGNSQTLYDCLSMTMNGDADEADHNVHLSLETADHQIRRVVDKRVEEVYVMNDAGATIDSYRWPSVTGCEGEPDGVEE